MTGDLQYKFIRTRLQGYLSDVASTMQVQMDRDGVQGTGLRGSISSRITGDDSVQVGELIFDESGRFLDMGVGKGHPLGGVKQTKAAMGKKGRKPGRKRKVIYSAIAYGKLNFLENQLLHGYTEEAISALKNMDDGISGG